MSESSPAEVVLWQQLGKYLKTEVEFGKPEINPEIRTHGRSTECIHLKVRFSNTAPDKPDWPRIVFTGVGLGIVPLGDRHAVSDSAPEWIAKVQRPDRTLQSRSIVGAPGTQFMGSVGTTVWEELTVDESKHGIELFRGDSATLELTIPVYDIPYFELHVEGGVSRRHFFHCDRLVKMPQT